MFKKKPITIEDIFGNKHIVGWRLALKNSVVAILVVVVSFILIGVIYVMSRP